MADDIIYRIGADTSDLDAAIQKVKSQNLIPGGAGGGILTALPPELGGAPRPATLLEKATSAAASQSADEMEKAKQKYKEFNETGEDTAGVMGQIANMTTRMVERMVIGAVVIGALKAAFDGLVATFARVIQEQQDLAQFQNLSTSMKDMAGDLEAIDEASVNTGTDVKNLRQAILGLERGGETAEQAARDIGQIAEMAKLAAEPAAKLVDQLTKLKLHTATIDDMQHLVTLTGDQKDQLTLALYNYQKMVEQIKEEEKQQEIVNRANERMLEIADLALNKQEQRLSRATQLEERTREDATRTMTLQERAADRQYALAQRQLDLQDRLTSAHQGMAERAGIDFASQLQQTGGAFLSATQAAAQSKMGPGMWSEALDLAREKAQQLQIGMHQIGAEQGWSIESVQRLTKAGIIDQRELMDAAKRAREDERRAAEYAQQDRRYEVEQKREAMELDRTMAQRKVEDQRYAIEQARQAVADEKRDAQWRMEDARQMRQIEIDTGKLSLENQVATAIDKQRTASEALAASAEKVTTFWERAGAAWDRMVRSGFRDVLSTEAIGLGAPPGATIPVRPNPTSNISAEARAAAERDHQLMEEQNQILRAGLLQ